MMSMTIQLNSYALLWVWSTANVQVYHLLLEAKAFEVSNHLPSRLVTLGPQKILPTAMLKEWMQKAVGKYIKFVNTYGLQRGTEQLPRMQHDVAKFK